eukprot:CAMPEP_0195288408 /NCGR_PEP_ID=MMETSP0707-20130614/5086_1 /TAXON_ID=33640 /ORGANISM="Asterionellopsis glacialis, Strain CCMP134" /LENGTH=447 /DNA_ID=CAMNT_0040348275 /DNA_START=12 /DNA_END=1355 /DNA_ORIENTATION=-
MMRGKKIVKKTASVAYSKQTNYYDESEDKYNRKGKVGGRILVLKSLLAASLLVSALILVVIPKKNKTSIAPVGTGSIRQSNLESSKRQAALVTRGRFPAYGTEEFEEQCKWTTIVGDNPSHQDPKCIYFLTPKPTEGISSWIAYIAEAYIIARLKGCKLLFQYEPGVDMKQVITPFGDHQLNNWTVPEGFKCNNENNCTVAGNTFKLPRELLPHYRFAYLMEKYFVRRRDYSKIEGSLDGFRLETGIACSLGVLFQLASTASLFEPKLYTDLLPTVRDEHNLVIAIYIRTSFTDVKAKNSTAQEDRRKYLITARHPIDCALSIEKSHFANSPELKSSVWMVITDSQIVKRDIQERYNGGEVMLQNNHTIIRRQVLSTGSRGAHSRPNVSPSTADFAEALIDWYMIGESDAVVVSMGASFGFTAGLRTARPFYSGFDCQKQALVHERL